jgi:hypothetical protein
MAIRFHDISASRSENGKVVERIEFTDKDSAWWYGEYQGGRIKTPADVRVRIAINHDGGPIADLGCRWKGGAPKPNDAIEFGRGDQWIQRHALDGKRGESGEEHKEIAAAALAFSQAVLDADPDICRRAQIAWHRGRVTDFERDVDVARRQMHHAQAQKATHEKSIAELEQGYTAETMSPVVSVVVGDEDPG